MTWSGWEDYKPPERATAQRAKPEPATPAKAQKAPRVKNARRTMVDGLIFDSQREATRWLALRGLESAGEITHLQRQVAYPLNVLRPDGQIETIARYVADFEYRRQGVLVTEDAKGLKTEIYRLKKRYFEAQYGRRILET